MSNRDGSYVELYDLTASHKEDNDLRASKPDVVAKLLDRLEAWKATLPAKPQGDVFSDERKSLAK